MTALARVIVARQHLRTLRAAAGTAIGAGNDVPPEAAALVHLLASDIVLDHLDQSLTDHIWAETVRHEDARDVLAVDVTALAEAIAPGPVPRLTPSQWKLLQCINAGRVFRPTGGEPVLLPKPVTKGKPALDLGEPVNGKTFPLSHQPRPCRTALVVEGHREGVSHRRWGGAPRRAPAGNPEALTSLRLARSQETRSRRI